MCCPDSLYSPGRDFNEAFLVLLEKKSTGEVVDADGTRKSYFTPGDARPLSVVNTDRRILANVMRGLLARLAAE